MRVGRNVEIQKHIVFFCNFARETRWEKSRYFQGSYVTFTVLDETWVVGVNANSQNYQKVRISKKKITRRFVIKNYPCKNFCLNCVGWVEVTAPQVWNRKRGKKKFLSRFFAIFVFAFKFLCKNLMHYRKWVINNDSI